MSAAVVRREKANIDGASIAYRIAGDGAPLLLLHGCPQTSHAWRHVMPRLSEKYTVIAPDLPGLGDSAPSQHGYGKCALAQYMHGLAASLGFDSVRLIGHDMGAAVAYAYAVQHRAAVSHLGIIDVMLAGAGFEEFGLNFGSGGGLWHFAFHMTPDIPELLIAGREREYLGNFWWGAAYDASAISNDDAEEDLRCYRAPGALVRYLAYYRSWLQDAADNKTTITHRLTIPVLGVGGATSMGNYVGPSLEHVADNVRTEVLERCGHWVPEEAPAALSRLIEDFVSE